MVLVFYPFAFSGVCTGELCEIRDNLDDFAAAAAEVLAISCDHFFSLRAYAEQDGYTFSLLSDFWPHGEVSRALDQFDEEVGCATRATLILDRDGHGALAGRATPSQMRGNSTITGAFLTICHSSVTLSESKSEQCGRLFGKRWREALQTVLHSLDATASEPRRWRSLSFLLLRGSSRLACLRF